MKWGTLPKRSRNSEGTSAREASRNCRSQKRVPPSTLEVNRNFASGKRDGRMQWDYDDLISRKPRVSESNFYWSFCSYYLTCVGLAKKSALERYEKTLTTRSSHVALYTISLSLGPRHWGPLLALMSTKWWREHEPRVCSLTSWIGESEVPGRIAALDMPATLRGTRSQKVY